jgi:hypothetical protein
MSLEEITKDAEMCAKNCWWQAHDEQNWDRVKDCIRATELILTKYTKKPIDGKLAGESFVEALKAYDNFTNVLRKEGPCDNSNTITARNNLQDTLEKFYSALAEQKSPELASATMGWWTNYAKSRMLYKFGDIGGYENAVKDLIANLTKEHTLRFELDENTASGLSHLMLSIAHLGHNKKDWAKAEQLLKSYYIELFSVLSEKN